MTGQTVQCRISIWPVGLVFGLVEGKAFSVRLPNTVLLSLLQCMVFVPFLCLSADMCTLLAFQ